MGLGRHGRRGNRDSENENSPVLRVENLSKTFGSRTLWKGHDFQASGGEIIALRGPSGCGKSILLSTIGLLIRPDSGHIVIDGTDILTIPRRRHKRVRRETIGYLFQD